MKTSVIRAAGLCALLADTALSTAALAQSVQPAFRYVDENGVDLTHGDFVLNFTEATVGGGANALALVRRSVDSNGSQWDNISLTDHSGTTAQVLITFVDRTERFIVGSGPTYTSTAANGATLKNVSGVFEHKAADGTVTVFGQTSALMSVRRLPTSMSTPDGQSVTLTWASSCGTGCPTGDYLESIDNDSGYAIVFSYGLIGGAHRRTGAALLNLTSLTSAENVSYAYSSANVVEVTTPENRIWRFTGNGTEVTGIRRPGSSTDNASISYTSGKVSSVTRDGITHSYARLVTPPTGSDPEIAQTTRTDPEGGQRIVKSDMSFGRAYYDQNERGFARLFGHDTSGRLTRITEPEGNYVEFTRDGRGNVTRTETVSKPGTFLPTMVTYATYTATCTDTSAICNQPLTTTDERGQVTEYEYDSNHGGVTKITAPAMPNGVRPQTRYGYALNNGIYEPAWVSACRTGPSEASCAGTSDERRIEFGYDPRGNVTSMTSRSGNTAGGGSVSSTQNLTYNLRGDLTSVDGPLAGTADTIAYRYNAARELVGTISPDPDGAGPLLHRADRNVIDANGLLTRVETGVVTAQTDTAWAAFSALETVEIGYDANSRPITQALKGYDGIVRAFTQTGYDNLGRVKCSALRMAPAAGSASHDACDAQASGATAPDRVTKMHYDAAGQVTEVETGFDTTDVRSETAATYTSNGKIETLADAEGNKTSYAYDGHDRLKKTSYPSTARGSGNSSSTDYEELTYEALTLGGIARTSPLVASVRLRDGQSIAFSYDNLSRLILKDVPNVAYAESDISYAYDNLGQVAQIGALSNANRSISYTYDAIGRQTGETSLFGTKAMQYDAAGRLTQLAYPGSPFFVDYEHLVTGEVTKIRENGATSGVGVLATLAYDDLGRRVSLTRGNGTQTNYAYDPVSRLSTLTQDIGGSGTAYDLTLGFSYNAASQIISNSRDNVAYSFAPPSEAVATTHDGLNRIAAHGGIAATHDPRGNLMSVGGRTFAYTSENWLAEAFPDALAYDAAGRLQQLATGASATRFDYAGLDLIAEYDANNLLKKRYVHGPGMDEPLVQYDYDSAGNAARRFLHVDERGSIVAHTDSTGGILHTLSYDEFGAPAATNQSRFQYTGQTWLPEVGLYYYKNRMYDPKLGRFLQPDPIEYEAGMNLYAYVKGDPVNLKDPLGLLPGDCANGSCEPFTVGGGSGLTGGTSFGSWFNGRIQLDMPMDGGGGGGGGEGPAHNYPLEEPLTKQNTQCTITQVAYALNFYAIPGADGAKTPGQSYKVSPTAYLGGGWEININWNIGHVRFLSTNGGLSVSNVTQADHLLHSGRVDMNIVGSQSSGFSIQGRGYGTNTSGWLAAANQKLGPSIFAQQFSKMKDALKQCGG
ncbi:MAG TPA: RHS repeat-associated core domain-containing protein [Allosphingosinicella sp.]|uniref:RHS repeat domain-containing protein n=1 Tax=Allosphingosinicella sp. TaxID=2823234 RepID=UPI002EDAB811